MTECNRCGECCERITFDYMDRVKSIAEWVKIHPEDREKYPTYDAEFIAENWNLNGDGRTYLCAKFDKVDRICTVHDTKPDICKGFPWYGKEPDEKVLVGLKNCSFWADVKDRIDA